MIVMIHCPDTRVSRRRIMVVILNEIFTVAPNKVYVTA